jgi:hypothetical protein
MSYRNVTIFFLCALVAMMWMRLNRCNSCWVWVISGGGRKFF